MKHLMRDIKNDIYRVKTLKYAKHRSLQNISQLISSLQLLKLTCDQSVQSPNSLTKQLPRVHFKILKNFNINHLIHIAKEHNLSAIQH